MFTYFCCFLQNRYETFRQKFGNEILFCIHNYTPPPLILILFASDTWQFCFLIYIIIEFEILWLKSLLCLGVLFKSFNKTWKIKSWFYWCNLKCTNFPFFCKTILLLFKKITYKWGIQKKIKSSEVFWVQRIFWDHICPLQVNNE